MSNWYTPWCWHKWGRWSSPHNGVFEKSSHSMGYFSVCQLRECEKCGKAEFRRLPQMRSLDGLKEMK